MTDSASETVTIGPEEAGERLDRVLRSRNAGFKLKVSGAPFTVGLDRGEAMVLCWRLLATAAGAIGPGEESQLDLASDGKTITLQLDVPESLRDAPEDSLVELRPGDLQLVETLAARFADQPGRALFVDYGPARCETGDTLQAVKAHKKVPVLDAPVSEKMIDTIMEAREQGDSVGGMVETAAAGVPAGLGSPFFGSLESRIAGLVYAIPAVKSVSFGAGAALSEMRGSEANDPYRMEDGHVRTITNHNGGILGGISTGMPIVMETAIKPTPSISMEQNTVDLQTGEDTTITIQGRHDPCIVPRALPVLEAALALVLADEMMEGPYEW
mgnify:CR=1 FL=1